MEQHKIPGNGVANGPMRQVKPVFRIINVETVEAATWNKEECLKLIRGIQEHGLDWELVVDSIPSKNKAQIEAQGLRFINKIKSINEAVIEFIKSQPPESLVVYLDNVENIEERKVGERNIPQAEEGVQRKGSSEEFNVRNPTNRPPQSSTKSKKPKKKKTKEEQPEARPMHEEEKVAPGIPPHYPQLVQQVMLPYQVPNVMTQLHEIKNELGSVSHNLEAEKPNCRNLLETDPHFKHYWDSLEKCSASLQNIVSDIYYIHMNSQQIHAQPMQHQMMMPQLYYPTDQLRARYMGPQFHQERPPGNEFQ